MKMIETHRTGLYMPADLDPNTVYTTGSHLQRITDTGDLLLVEDPQLGVFTIGGNGTPYEKIMYQLMTTPGMRRADGVSQLCKDTASATIPNTASFTRRAGMTALVTIIEHFANQQGLSDEQILALQLALVPDDSAHKFFSHATELQLQGWGGRENKHQKDWPEYAQHGGTTDVLDNFGVTYDKNITIPGVELPPWAHAEAPDLDPDRLQYAATELLEWFDHDAAPDDVRTFVRQLCSLDNFTIDAEGHLAFREIEIARLFSKGYLLLATEHWNDPLNRMQLYMLTQAVQRIIVARHLPWMDEVDKGEMRRPEWYFNGIDQDIVDSMYENHGHTDPTLFAIHNALYPIASAERKRFLRYKLGEYARFLMDEKASDYPSEYLSPARVQFGLSHPSVAIEMRPSKMRDTKQGGKGNDQKMPIPKKVGDRLMYILKPLKNRFVDPRVITSAAGDSKRLSQLDKNYRSLLAQQQGLQGMETIVELVFASKFSAGFTDSIQTNQQMFDELADRPQFTGDQKRHIIDIAAKRADDLAQRAGRLVLL